MSMAMTMMKTTAHTSATINRFLGKVNKYEPGLLNMIFEMVFVPCKGGERSNRFIRYVYDPTVSMVFESHAPSYHHSRELRIKSIHGAEIILITDKNCHVPGNFAYCSHNSLKHILNPEYILGINDSSFRWCSRLESFTFNNNIEMLPSQAFSGCFKLKIAQLPSKLRVLGDYCFCGCRNIRNLTLPNTLKRICNGAFCHSGLESISIPNSVDTLNLKAFLSCKQLKQVKLNNNITELGGMAFAYCINLTYVNIPYGLKSIDSKCFYECSNLKSIELPNSLESISERAFFKSGLESIKIPYSVTNIQSEAFRYCKHLKTASLPIHLKPIIDASSPRDRTSIFNRRVKITYRYPFKIKEKRT